MPKAAIIPEAVKALVQGILDEMNTPGLWADYTEASIVPIDDEEVMVMWIPARHSKVQEDFGGFQIVAYHKYKAIGIVAQPEPDIVITDEVKEQFRQGYLEQNGRMN